MVHPRIIEWLNSDTNQGHLTIRRLCELICVNGGSPEVQRVGNVVPNDTVWGRSGLTPAEALELTELNAFLLGMCYLSNCLEQVRVIIQNKISQAEGRFTVTSVAEAAAMGIKL